MFASGGREVARPFTSRCSVGPSGLQSISSGGYSKVQFDTVEYDGQSEFDEVTNYRFTAGEAGLYHVDTHVVFWALAADDLCLVLIYVDGVVKRASALVADGVASRNNLLSADIWLEAESYIEIYVYQNSGVGKNISNILTENWLNIHRVQ